MNEETDPKDLVTSLSDDEPPVLTEEDVKAALERGVAGANELAEDLKEVFTLTDASAAMRLR
jgi:hypothetical protein